MAENPDKFRVVALAAGSNVTLLADQVILRFHLLPLSYSFHLLPLSNDWNQSNSIHLRALVANKFFTLYR